jgi:hypothetical protein
LLEKSESATPHAAPGSPYAFYNDHTTFIRSRWIPEVAEFMKIDDETIGGL